DVPARRGPGGEVARRPRLAVDEHEAGTAQAEDAAEPRPGQARIVPENFKQGSVRLTADGPRRPVHGQLKFLLHPAGLPFRGALARPSRTLTSPFPHADAPVPHVDVP